MSLHVEDGVIRLVGRLELADAEPLCAALVERPERIVDLSALESAHTAVIQALLAFRPPLRGEPADPFVRTAILPALGASAPTPPPPRGDNVP